MTRFWTVLGIALLLGPGLPLAFLYLAKAFTTKIPAPPLSARLIPITVEDRAVLRDGRPFWLDNSDLNQVVKPSGLATKQVAVGDVSLAAKPGASPFGQGYVSVVAPGWDSAAGSFSPTSGAIPNSARAGTSARLPLAVHNHWVVLSEPGSPQNQAQVLLLLDGDIPDAAKLDEFARQLQAELPDTLRRLRQTSAELGQRKSGWVKPGKGKPADGAVESLGAQVTAEEPPWDFDASSTGGAGNGDSTWGASSADAAYSDPDRPWG